jgi:hypothetical protein
MVILTNDCVKKPLLAYDRYDRRSNMENSLFREAKKAWFIQRPAKNTKSAFCAHVYLTLTIMALTNVFQVWLAEQNEKNKKGVVTGIRKFRELVRVENANKVIVFGCRSSGTTRNCVISARYQTSGYLHVVKNMVLAYAPRKIAL